MAHSVGIIGGSGYTGIEVLRLLAGHPSLRPVTVTAATNAGRPLGEVAPSLAAAYPDLVLGTLDDAPLDGLDLVFVALPHGESQQLMGELVARAGHVVDLGADFRLPVADYERWYGARHGAPELADVFELGIPELFRARIAGARHVAAPGCYPTASALALAPAVAAGVVEPTGIIVDAMSGLSGAGRGLKLHTHFSEADESVSAYGLLTHRHTAEIELVLGRLAATPVEVLFTPHLVPMARGIHATCHAQPAQGGLTTAALVELYRDFYADEPFVEVVDEPPATKAVTASNVCLVTVRADERTGGVLAIGVIDNLVKGASGQAIQNANLLLGLAETDGLATTGLWP